MDTAEYFFKSRGQEIGPYRFYQLQQKKTDEELTAAQFEADEWEHFSQFVETGDLNENTATYIRRVETVEKPKTKKRPFLATLTWAGYAVGWVSMIAGLLQVNNNFFPPSRVVFWVGLWFSIGLTHLMVDRSVRAKLTANKDASRTLIFRYLLGLLPIASVIALTAAAAEFLLKKRGFSGMDVLNVAKFYFGAGAFVAIVVPFYLRGMVVYHYLTQPRGYSVPWIFSLVVLFALLGSYYFVPQKETQQTASRPMAKIAPERKGRLTWHFPVKLRESRESVLTTLGSPEETIGRELIYRQLGVRIAISEADNVAKLRFTVPDSVPFEAATNRIVGDITMQMPREHVETSLEVSPTAVFSDSGTITYIWEESGCRISACFARRSSTTDGKVLPANSMKWFEVGVPEGAGRVASLNQ